MGVVAIPRINRTNLLASMGQSTLSLSFTLGGLLAGTLLSKNFGIFSLAPWTLILFPGILSMRGAIGGLFCARLSTGLHLGTVRARYTNNTKNFFQLLCATITLALESSVILGLVVSLFNVFLRQANIVDFIRILVVIPATMGLSLIFISPITMVVSFLSFKHGLNPDIIVYPITATMADIVITACYIFILKVLFSLPIFGNFFIALLDLIFLAVVLYILLKNIKEDEFVKTIREFSFTLISLAFLVSITGSVLHELSRVIGSKLEIFMVYPSMIDTIGGVGSIVGSTATTKLALGEIEPYPSSIKEHLSEINSVWVASIMMFIIYSVVSSFVHGKTLLNDILIFTLQLLITNFLAVLFIVVIAYIVAIFTYRREWDPDNFVIPLESSLADSLTTISLLIALNIVS